MAFSGKVSEASSNESYLNVPANVLKHQLKIEFYNESGQVDESIHSIEGVSILGRVPSAMTFDHVANIENRYVIINGIFEELWFIANFSGNYTYKVFWCALD